MSEIMYRCRLKDSSRVWWTIELWPGEVIQLEPPLEHDPDQYWQYRLTDENETVWQGRFRHQVAAGVPMLSHVADAFGQAAVMLALEMSAEHGRKVDQWEEGSRDDLETPGTDTAEPAADGGLPA